MDDRVIKAEGGDVLSSIRKLVAEDMRSVSPPRPAGSRLVLTQALRVDSTPPPAPPPRLPSPLVLERPPGSTIPLVMELPYIARPLPPEAMPPLMAAPLEVYDDVEEDADEAIHPGGTDPGAELAARLAELEAMLDSQDLGFEPEAEPMDEAPEAPFITDGTLDLDDPVPSAFDWIEVGAEPAAELSPVMPAGHVALDEPTLRALIREVLREELEGAMGERATRSLRRLIRDELNRALIARGVL